MEIRFVRKGRVYAAHDNICVGEDFDSCNALALFLMRKIAEEDPEREIVTNGRRITLRDLISLDDEGELDSLL